MSVTTFQQPGLPPRAVRSRATSTQARYVALPTATSTGQVRLTRRGRFVLMGLPLMLLAAVVLLAGGFFASTAKASVGASGPAGNGAVAVTVQPGQSLWAIAQSVDSGRDPRDVMADIVELNALDSSVVHPGEQLYVPAAR